MNTTFVTVNLILCFFFSIFSIHPKLQEKNPRSGLLQSAIVTAFCTYLVWSAISSETTDMQCSNIQLSDQGSTVSTILGIAFTFVAVIYSALRTASSDIQGERAKLVPQPVAKSDDPEEAKKEGDAEGTDDSEEGSDSVPYNFSFFHLTFGLAALYLCMVLTNWNFVPTIDTGVNVDQGMAAVWIKAVSSWVTMGLYMWSLIAPIVFPNRQF